MEKTKLQKCLKLHFLWLKKDTEGVRANLSEADLSGANLRGANLSSTILEGKSILSFQFQRHTAYFWGADEIRIGCHRKPVSEWLETYKQVGKDEVYTKLETKKYGEFIKIYAKILERESK